MYIRRTHRKGSNGNIYTSTSLARNYRENGKVKVETIHSLNGFSETEINNLDISLKATKRGDVDKFVNISVQESIDIGLILVLINILEELKITKLFDNLMPKNSGLIKLMIVGKIITKGSKLAIFNWVKRNPLYANLLGVDLSNLSVDDLYDALTEATNIQGKLERKWGVYHKTKFNEIFLYDITSSYFEGDKNALSEYGYNRDGKKGKKQIVIGLITDDNGFPLKIEVFKGNTADQVTVQDQILQIKEKFDAKKIIFVGDRGMKIKYNLEQMNNLEHLQVDYISGLSTDEIKGLLSTNKFSLDLFSEDKLTEVDDGGVRYILSKNPILEQQNRDTRNQLKESFLHASEEIREGFVNRKKLNKENRVKLSNGAKNKRLKISFTKEDICEYKKRLSKIASKYKMVKFFDFNITKTKFEIIFKDDKYEESKNLDGIYVIITSVDSVRMDKKEVRQTYKYLQNVEHAFRDMKTTQLEIRPIYHVKASTTKGHVLVTMFSFAVIHEMEKHLHPLLQKLNKMKNEKLSFNDLIAELENIKLVKLKIGNIFKNDTTEPNENQKNILKSLNYSIDKMKNKIKM
ncbi:MAG: IS1634 family transposase [Salinivirgaceae bacterium]|jgi:transposase|nr:IS1634 family transposase [Salinivirgaceae bacterium]